MSSPFSASANQPRPAVSKAIPFRLLLARPGVVPPCVFVGVSESRIAAVVPSKT